MVGWKIRTGKEAALADDTEGFVTIILGDDDDDDAGRAHADGESAPVADGSSRLGLGDNVLFLSRHEAKLTDSADEDLEGEGDDCRLLERLPVVTLVDRVGLVVSGLFLFFLRL